MNDLPDIDLSALLRFEVEEGRIWLDDYRMVLLSACALGALRKELIKSLGWDTARGVLKRFGYAAGLADVVAMRQRFPMATADQQRHIGPQLHALEGVAKVVWKADAEAPDARGAAPLRDSSQAERPCGDFWRNSFEAEQHLDLLGPADEPVCWTLAGYASGHASAASERRVMVVETECVAMGHERCHFVTVTSEQAPDLYAREEPDYAPRHLPEELQRLHETIEDKDKTIVRLRSQAHSARPRGRFIGDSPILAKALDTAQAVAPYSSSVLVLGESGTGKELLARFVHEQSSVPEHPFVAVNCSALPESLQEAELFGYARGAFTGASAPQTGVFEAAHGGTLFLDEVGDLSLTAQTKILRALQEGEIKRLGEVRTRQARPRIVAATHQDLSTMVQEGSFREDLYYRLSVVIVRLPPLRERGDDIVLLADHFLRLYSQRFNKDTRELSHEAARALLHHGWPGNVRELENVIQRAVILATSPRVQAADLPESLTRPRPAATTQGSETERKTAQLESLGDERERLLRALKLARGKRERAAELLGISRTTLWRRMKALKIDAPDEGDREDTRRDR